MEMTGEYRIPAPREKVWEALNDPEVLKKSIPGCKELEKESDTEMTAKVAAKVGPVSATFSGKVTLSDINPPESYKISGEGQGGVAGFAKGGADVSLSEENGETVLSYKVNASVGGKLAQIGSRLIDSTAKKMADQFFTQFVKEVAGEEAEAKPVEGEGAESGGEEKPSGEEPEPSQSAEKGSSAGAAAAGMTPEEKAAEASPATSKEAVPDAAKTGIKPAVWIGGLIAVVVIILIILGTGG